MHKNIPVVDFEIDTASGTVASIGTVHQEEHLPVGIPVKQGAPVRGAFNDWWCMRAIPASRLGLKHVLAELNISAAQLLVEKCMGLSLSDQYWMKPAGSLLCWEQVNFFENPFSEDMGNLLFGGNADRGVFDLMSPDNTSDGWLKKKWVIIDGKRCLIKSGSGATQQEPYNEVLASRIMERMHIPHVTYTLRVEEGYPYSICEDFLTPETELVSAWYIMQTRKRQNHISVYQHYLDCCSALGILGVREQLEQMMVLDYLIVNEDRHQNNFGVIRHAGTLEYVGAAPVFDSGTSLWFDKPWTMINAGAKVACKPFKNNHEEQIKLVTDLGWVDFSALAGIEEELRELVRGSLFIDDRRCDALCRGLKGWLERLEKHALSHSKRRVFLDDTRYDVTENTAYSGEDV